MKRLMVLLLSIMMIVQLMPAVTFAEDGEDLDEPIEDVSGSMEIGNPGALQIVKDSMEFTLSQDNKIIEGADDKIDALKPVSVELSFKVPVLGDGEYDADHIINKGDSFSFNISNNFIIVGSKTEFPLYYSEESERVNVGTLYIETKEDGMTIGHVVFDGDEEVFDPEAGEGSSSWSGILCQFSAEFKYNGSVGDDNTGDHQITILEKDYTINVPKIPTVVGGSKSGTVDFKNQKIDWKIKVSAERGEEAGDISGYVFEDDLSDVGEYVENSFKITLDSEGKIPAIPEEIEELDAEELFEYDAETKTIKYTFPAETVGERYIFFSTKVSDEKFLASDKQTITNTAVIKKDDSIEKELIGSVEFTAMNIKKDAAYSESTPDEIRWKITANTNGVSLKDAQIVDVLDSKLLWESATLYRYDPEQSEENKWVQVKSFDDSLNEDLTPTKGGPENGIYELGDISYPVMLEIVTKVDVDNYNIGHTVQHITNSATIKWTTPDGGSGSQGDDEKVTIGLNPIRKHGESYDAKERKAEWTLSIEKSDVSEGLVVMDLLVYGNKGIDLTKEDYVIDGDVDSLGLNRNNSNHIEKLRNIESSVNQKYVEGSFTSDDGLTCTVYPVMKGSTRVADLLVIKGSDESDGYIDVSEKTQTCSFKSLITNPNVYLSNGGIDIKNIAVLFSYNEKINRDDGTVKATNKLIDKNVIPRSEDADGYGDLTDLNVVNNMTGNAGNAFDYMDHSIVYRIHLNQSGIDFEENKEFWETNGDNVTTKTLGKAIVTDVLPKGWTYGSVSGEKKYAIFTGTRIASDSRSVIAETELTDELESEFVENVEFTEPTADKGEGMTITFKKFDQPMVIVVKAVANDDAAKEYLSSVNTQNSVRNTAYLKTENWNNWANDWEDVTIESDIIDKNIKDTVQNGQINWKVEYKPENVDYSEDLYIVDKLPFGFDLRLDKDGKLDIAKSGIKISEREQRRDGTYVFKESIVPELDNNVSYDPVKKELKFTIPDKNKGYLFEYITDITGDPGVTYSN